MALSEAEELELLELEEAEALSSAAPAQPASERAFFGDKRASGGIEGLVRGTPQREANPARQAEAAVIGVGSGLLGVGDYAAAAGDQIRRKITRPLLGKEAEAGGFGESLESVRSQRKALESEYPVTSAAGNVAGALIPVAPLGAAFKAGQPIANTAKAAGFGAAQAGVTTANLGGDAEDVATSAGIGALASPAVGAIARVGGATVNAVRSAIDKNSDEGFRALSKALRRKGSNVTPEDLKTRAAAFREATGRGATVTEIVGERGGETLADLTSGSQRAVDQLAASARKQAVDLQQNVAEGVRARRKVPAVTKQERLRKVAADNAMGKIGDAPVKFDTASIKELVDDRRVYKALPDEEKQLLLDISDSGGELTIRQVDNIRQALRSRGKGAGGGSAKLREFADGLVEGPSTQVPQYGRFLKSFGRRSQAIEGQKIGQKVLSTAKTNEFVDVVQNRLSKPGRGGAVVGAREALVDAAAKSPESAARTAAALADDAGLAQRITAVAGPDEAARLRRLGAAEQEGIRSVSATVKAPKGQVRAEAQASRDAADAVLALAGAGSLSFKVSIASRLTNQFKVPPTAAKKLADALTDPARTDEAIGKLIKMGVEPRVVEQVARAASQVAARTAGPLVAGADNQ